MSDRGSVVSLRTCSRGGSTAAGRLSRSATGGDQLLAGRQSDRIAASAVGLTQFAELDVLTDCWLRRSHFWTNSSCVSLVLGRKETRWTESQWEPLLMNWRPWRRFASVKSGNVPTCTWTERSARYSSPAPSSIWPVPSLQSFESVSIFQSDLGSPATNRCPWVLINYLNTTLTRDLKFLQFIEEIMGYYLAPSTLRPINSVKR